MSSIFLNDCTMMWIVLNRNIFFGIRQNLNILFKILPNPEFESEYSGSNRNFWLKPEYSGVNRMFCFKQYVELLINLPL